jgi:hypothetical protein
VAEHCRASGLRVADGDKLPSVLDIELEGPSQSGRDRLAFI